MGMSSLASATVIMSIFTVCGMVDGDHSVAVSKKGFGIFLPNSARILKRKANIVHPQYVPYSMSGRALTDYCLSCCIGNIFNILS